MTRGSTEAQEARIADSRNMPEYTDGRLAYIAGEPSDANPYPSGERSGFKRLAWFNGWYDEWRITKHGE